MSKKSVEFHIEHNDYFGTLASVLSLVRQTIDDEKFQKTNVEILNDLEGDLIFLQNKFKIVKK